MTIALLSHFEYIFCFCFSLFENYVLNSLKIMKNLQLPNIVIYVVKLM